MPTEKTINAEAFKAPVIPPPNPEAILEQMHGRNSYENAHSDSQVVEARRESERIHAEAKAEALATRKTREAKEKLAAAERARAEAEAEIANQRSISLTLDAMNKSLDAEVSRLKRADQEFASLITVDRLLESITERFGGEDRNTSGAGAINNAYVDVVALELFHREFPKWRASFAAHIESAKKDIVEFARKHGIEPQQAAPVGLTLADLQIGEAFTVNGERFVVEDLDNTVPLELRVVRDVDGYSHHWPKGTRVARIDRTELGLPKKYHL